MTNDYVKAGNEFKEVKDTDSKYASAATYYYAHMAYVNKNYETALKLYESSGIENLNNEEIANLKFHKGATFHFLPRNAWHPFAW